MNALVCLVAFLRLALGTGAMVRRELVSAATAVTVLLVLILGIGPAHAESAAAFGGRLSLGAGTPPGNARGAIFEAAPRLDAFWGRDIGVGPTIEFRTANFGSAEASVGLSTFISNDDLGMIMTLAGGYAWRRTAEDGVIVAATLGYGIVHVRSPWILSTTVYVAFRHSATGPSRDEFTAGLSFGGGALYGITSIVTGDHG